ncbi:MAG: glycosyltransferase family protein [Bdellovibrionota bacterium]
MKQKVVCTVEARMTSSRLPGKVLLPAAGKPLLSHLIERLKLIPSVDEIVLATTINAQDNPLAELAASMGIKCFRGSENDVMGRVIGAAESAQADIVVEITADCPLIDSDVAEQVIRLYQRNQCDYASNAAVRSYPDGMDVQVFSLACLKKSAAMTNDQSDREHVTRHIRLNPEIFRQLHLIAGPLDYAPELGLTLDEPKDYELIKKIFETLGDRAIRFTCRELIRLLNVDHPEWLEINKSVVRKELN